MDGEWWFNIKNCSFDLDLSQYHAQLREIKAKYEGGFGDSARWFTEDEAKKSNVFVSFTYTCSRHTAWKNGSKHRPQWKLYWNPMLVSKESLESDLHARCSPWKFTTLSYEIQSGLVDLFPQVFLVYFGDGLDGYGGGLGAECFFETV